jgi:hypothetical protein
MAAAAQREGFGPLAASLPFNLEQFSIRLDRSIALAFCFDAFSSREPVSTSLENALDGAAERL